MKLSPPRHSRRFDWVDHILSPVSFHEIGGAWNDKSTMQALLVLEGTATEYCFLPGLPCVHRIQMGWSTKRWFIQSYITQNFRGKCRYASIGRVFQRKRMESLGIAWKRMERTVSDGSASIAHNRINLTPVFPEVCPSSVLELLKREAPRAAKFF